MVSSKGRRLVFDAEANGFLNEATRIWCFYFIDIDTDEGFLFHDFEGYCGYTGEDDKGEEFTIPVKAGSLKDGARFAHQAKQLIAHNQIGYDQFLIKKFYPKYKIRYNYPEIRDTLLESQVQWFDRRPVKGYKGIHGLAVWGARLGIRKPEIEDWTTFDPLKLHRCIEDVKINQLTAEYLTEERQKIFDKCGLDFTQALEIEHEYRYWCTHQELNGALVDVPHMQRCLGILDEKLEELRKILEPQLPPSVKVKGGKITKQDLFKSLGIDKQVPVQYIIKEIAGVEKQYEVKDWFKPCTKWTNKKKGKLYGIVNKKTEEILLEPQFKKVKEARDYAKEHFPDVKKFIFPNIETVSEEIDSNTKSHFGDKLDNIEIVGSFTKVELIPSRMSQHEKVKLYMLGLGWDTDEWTFEKDEKGGLVRAEISGVAKWPKIPYLGKQLKIKYKAGDKVPMTPKVSDDSLLTLPEGLGDNINLYNAYKHRRNFIQNPTKGDKGLLNNIREDGRITCGIMTFGTTAGRASHNNWVNPPSGGVVFGKEIREIIIAPEGSSLVGIDMPSAHPRLLADFTQNETFIKAVDGLEEDPETGEYIGEDFHTVNSVLFKLNTQEEVDEARKTQRVTLVSKLSKGRKKGKGGSYATLYGGSGPKVALTLGLPKEEGEPLKQGFLAGLGLDSLLKEIEQDWKKHSWAGGSYITVLGGYHIWCASKHKIINYKALGSEAVVQKVAIILLCRKLQERGLLSKVKQVISMHDETLYEILDEVLPEAKPLIADMYKEAAHYLGLTLDWTSAAKEGSNYYVCH